MASTFSVVKTGAVVVVVPLDLATVRIFPLAASAYQSHSAETTATVGDQSEHLREAPTWYGEVPTYLPTVPCWHPQSRDHAAGLFGRGDKLQDQTLAAIRESARYRVGREW